MFLTLRHEWAKAWKLRPEAPEPPSLVFDQMWSSPTVAGADAMEWLSRVLAARFDYEPAYADMLSRLRPDFLGSVEEHAAFGRACAETHRFDTSVPLMLPRALRTACMARDWRPICRDPRTGRALVALARGMLAEPMRASQAHLWKSLAAVWALLGGEDRAALEALNALGEQPLHPAALHEMRWFDTSLDELRGDLAVRLSPAREDDERGQALYRKGEVEEACAAFRRALELAPADARAQALSKRRLAIAEFERALPGGDWMEVPTDLNLWQVVQRKLEQRRIRRARSRRRRSAGAYPFPRAHRRRARVARRIHF